MTWSGAAAALAETAEERRPLTAEAGARILLGLCARQCAHWTSLPPAAVSAAGVGLGSGSRSVVTPPLAPHASAAACARALRHLQQHLQRAVARGDWADGGDCVGGTAGANMRNGVEAADGSDATCPSRFNARPTPHEVCAGAALGLNAKVEFIKTELDLDLDLDLDASPTIWAVVQAAQVKLNITAQGTLTEQVDELLRALVGEVPAPARPGRGKGGTREAGAAELQAGTGGQAGGATEATMTKLIALVGACCGALPPAPPIESSIAASGAGTGLMALVGEPWPALHDETDEELATLPTAVDVHAEPGGLPAAAPVPAS